MSQKHPLLAWMRDHEVSMEELAHKLAAERKIEPESLRQIAYGYRRPSWDLAFSIERATKKAVKATVLRAWEQEDSADDRKAG